MDVGILILVATLVGCLAAGGLVLRGLVAANRRADELPRELQALGARHGLAFSARAEDEEEPLVAGTTFVARFGDPRFRVSGSLDGLQVDVLGVLWKRGFSTAEVRPQLAVVFSSPVERWPRFLLTGESSETPEELGVTDLGPVELSGEALDGVTLWARSAEDARAFFTPRLTAALAGLARASGPLVVESFPGRLVLWRESVPWPSESFEPLLAEARQLRALFDQAVAAGPTPPAGRCPRCAAALVPSAPACGACGTALAIG